MSSIAPQPSTERASASPPRSRSPSPALQLDPSTLAALSAFYDEQAEAERQFQELEKKAHERLEKAREGDAAAAGPPFAPLRPAARLTLRGWLTRTVHLQTIG